MASASARNQDIGESSMLVCPASHCPLPVRSRTFSSADALLEHARQTRVFHPMCTTCLRVFKDTIALDQHVEAKHVSSRPYNRKNKSQSAIDQFWRASSAQPHCPVCGARATDTSALAAHISNAHPKVRCCGSLWDEKDLDIHYLNSRNHPVCDKCKIGFPSELEYSEHNSDLHPELQCRICSEQFPSAEALKSHAADPTSHRRCEFCSAQFRDTSALVEHFTETHLQIQDASDPAMEASSPTCSPSSSTNQLHGHPSWGHPTSAVFGAEREATGRLGPSSSSSTSLGTMVSEIASELCRSPPSVRIFTPPTSHSTSSSDTSPPQHPSNNLPARSSQPGHPPPQSPNNTCPTYVFGSAVGLPSMAMHVSPTIRAPPLVPSSSPSPSPPPVRPSAVGPATPARKVAHTRSQSQAQVQSQSHQSGLQPPSSSRSKVSVAETPSGDLANFHLLKGSPLQSVVDFDTPTPSPRTPSMPSVSPAEAQDFALAASGRSSLPLIADRRVFAGSSISPSLARALRAITKSSAVRSSFHCRVCQVDPCHEITATTCGHLFCNACIVEEVRENARCPVCNAVVLLFALLKLDISS
ncbi:hypothetical protein F5148DRAFT_1169374 [Russula earlei]|uniref:Uncharacterized protein n=1 Tax=Russula earlei TaxID=71964 RepID=A0ACC0ULE5_9AGAM|nr:hypothetical protein F5148DRAFT_1169374 [Russula earlei]